ncbi:MAG: MinD/ParA family protein [Clostridia bacterium]|nr:MinD/ParA family protein [Clostridia bacterium]
MKKIVTAIGNPNLNNRLKKEEEIQVIAEDIQYQEGILEILEKGTTIDYLILSELLPGNFTIKDLVQKIKEINSNVQIILFLENQKEELENYLYAKGIFAIFYHNQVGVKEIIEIMKDNKNTDVELRKELEQLKKMLIEKEELRLQPQNKNTKKGIHKKKKQIKKEIICVSGTNGVGKSIFTVNLARLLAQQRNKVLIIDFDILNNSLHTILGVKKYSEKIKEKMKNHNLLKEIQIEELIIKVSSKIDLIAGVNLLFDNKYQISSTKIKSILDKLKEEYDMIIIDTTSECFFDYTKEIMKISNLNIFILEANVLEIKKAKRLLDMYIQKWKIPQSNFNLLFNKYNQNAIDYAILKQIFSGFSILGKLSNHSQYNLIINKGNKNNLDKKLQTEYSHIQRRLFQKESLLSQIPKVFKENN